MGLTIDDLPANPDTPTLNFVGGKYRTRNGELATVTFYRVMARRFRGYVETPKGFPTYFRDIKKKMRVLFVEWDQRGDCEYLDAPAPDWDLMEMEKEGRKYRF